MEVKASSIKVKKYAVPTKVELESTHKGMLKRWGAESIDILKKGSRYYLKFKIPNEEVLDVVSKMCDRVIIPLICYTDDIEEGYRVKYEYTDI